MTKKIKTYKQTYSKEITHGRNGHVHVYTKDLGLGNNICKKCGQFKPIVNSDGSLYKPRSFYR